MRGKDYQITGKVVLRETAKKLFGGSSGQRRECKETWF